LKHRLFIIPSILWTILSFGQTTKERDFGYTLKMVVAALSKRDSATLSMYTDKKTGVYILNRIGVVDTYKHFQKLGFSDTTYPNAPFYDDVKLTTLKYSKLPTFNCEKWTETGTFVDTTRIDHLFSKIAKVVNKESGKKVTAKTINEFYSLENKSRRVIIAANGWNELIIYLSFIGNKWVLTIIDKATCDCSV
jgi:hypothetical protein